jgi:NTP pyrophosphatase (non-canonical NTP hydrolase)
MSELKDSMKAIFEFQKAFDSKRGWDWSNPGNKKEQMQFLQHGTIALAGEVGEFANTLKKAMRHYESTGELPNKEYYQNLNEEIVDVFIYVVKLCIALGLDLSDGYYNKMKVNDKKFANYVKK